MEKDLHPILSEAYSEPRQMSKMERFTKKLPASISQKMLARSLRIPCDLSDELFMHAIFIRLSVS